MEQLSAAMRDVLRQCAKDAVWDGDIVSKSGRDALHKNGYLFRADGYTYITETGRQLLAALPQIQRPR